MPAPIWIKVKKILDDSKEYRDFFSYWHSGYSSDSEKAVCREIDKDLRHALENELAEGGHREDLKELWKDIFNYAETWNECLKEDKKVLA